MRGRVIQTLQRFAATAPAPPTPSPYWQYGATRERDYRQDVGDGSQSSLVIPGIDFIANGFIEAPLRVMQRTNDGWDEIVKHSLPEVIEDPNDYYDGATLWLATIADWIADGNSYWIKSRAGSDRLAGFWWAPSWTMEPKGSKDGKVFIERYEYRPGGMVQMVPYKPSEIVHFRFGMDPRDPRKGQSRLKAILRLLYTDEEAARFTVALLRNLGVVGLVLSPKGDVEISPTEALDRKTQLMQSTTGDRRGEPLVMFSATDVQTYGTSPSDMDLAKVVAIAESRAAAILGIPAAVLGFLAGLEQTKVGATMSELRDQAWESGIIPKMRLIDSQLRRQVLTEYHDDVIGMRVEHRLDDVRALQEDQNKAATRWATMVGAPFAKIAEARSYFGLPVEEGDDVRMVPFNLTEQGAPPAADPQQPKLMRFAQKQATPGQLAYLRQMNRAGQMIVPDFASDLTTAFGDLGNRAATEFAGLKFIADPVDENRVMSVVEAMAIEQWLQETMGPIWRRYYLRLANLTYDALRAHIGLDIGIGIPDPIARQVVEMGGRRLGLLDLSRDTRSALFEALASGREDGLGPAALARRIRQYVSAGRFTGMEQAKAGSGVNYRANMIARTETLHAQRIAVAETGQAAGFTRYLAFDNRTGYDDPECLARDGQVYTYNQMLAETNEEHPNGTLGWAPVPGSELVPAVAARRAKITRLEYGTDGRIARAIEETA